MIKNNDEIINTLLAKQKHWKNYRNTKGTASEQRKCKHFKWIWNRANKLLKIKLENHKKNSNKGNQKVITAEKGKIMFKEKKQEKETKNKIFRKKDLERKKRQMGHLLKNLEESEKTKGQRLQVQIQKQRGV